VISSTFLGDVLSLLSQEGPHEARLCLPSLHGCTLLEGPLLGMLYPLIRWCN